MSNHAKLFVAIGLAGLMSAACSQPQGAANEASIDGDVTLRNLTETDTSAALRTDYAIEGELIPTPSDSQARYYLLRDRSPITTDTVIALLREERGAKAAYARVEISCPKRLFHIVGIGNRRSFAETSTTRDGPLRPMTGLPLREEIATFVCNARGTPLGQS